MSTDRRLADLLDRHADVDRAVAARNMAARAAMEAFSLRALAAAVGVSPQTIANWAAHAEEDR